MNRSIELKTAEVNFGGLMNILGRHLYSTPVIALRELVQNAHDSIIRRQLEDPSFGEIADYRITVSADAAAGTLSIQDNGAGLTYEEINRYLATLGSGYTGELRERSGSPDLIGMFGLGFLTAFILADRVQLHTVSWQNDQLSWRYQSTNGRQYTLEEAPLRPVGSDVTLYLNAQYQYLADDHVLQDILRRYCSLLTIPLFVAGHESAINSEAPPWRAHPAKINEHPIQRRRQELAFAAKFEHRFEPICTILVAPQGKSDASGLLWIQDGATYGTSDNRNLSVFVRGMLLDDDVRELLPTWAGFIGGVIESAQLMPAASRETLQMDDHYDAVKAALNETIIDGLADIAHQQPEAWRRTLNRHNEALLGAALCDDRLFDLLADSVRLPSSQGDLPVRALLTGNALHVALSGESGFEEILFHALGVPIARGDRYAVLPFLRQWVARKGGTLVEVGGTPGNHRLFREGQLPSDVLDWFKLHLANDEQIIPAHFSPPELPFVVVPDREAELKRLLEADEADMRISSAILGLARAYTQQIDNRALSRLYINLDNPTIKALITTCNVKIEPAMRVARLLHAIKTIMSLARSNVVGNRDTHANGNSDLNAALTSINEAAFTLLLKE